MWEPWNPIVGLSGIVIESRTRKSSYERVSSWMWLGDPSQSRGYKMIPAPTRPRPSWMKSEMPRRVSWPTHVSSSWW